MKKETKEKALPSKDKKQNKKLSGKQKIALERIYRLFELAEKQKDEELSKRYLQLAKRIGEKVNVRIPTELKQKYCKKCYSLEVKIIQKEGFVEIKCKKCGYSRKTKTL